MSDSMRPKADDVVPPCMDFDNPGPHVWTWKYCKNCGKREPFASRDAANSARKDELATRAKAIIRGLDAHVVTCHHRDTGLCLTCQAVEVLKALTAYSEERTPSGEGWQPIESATWVERNGQPAWVVAPGITGEPVAMFAYWNARFTGWYRFAASEPMRIEPTLIARLPPAPRQNVKDATPPASSGEGK